MSSLALFLKTPSNLYTMLGFVSKTEAEKIMSVKLERIDFRIGEKWGRKWQLVDTKELIEHNSRKGFVPCIEQL